MNQNTTIVGGQRQRNQTEFFSDVQQYHPTMPSSTNQQSKKRRDGSSTALTTTTNTTATNTTNNKKKKVGDKSSDGRTITQPNISIAVKERYDAPLHINNNAVAHNNATLLHDVNIIFKATLMKEIEIDGKMVNIGSILRRVEIDISHLDKRMRKGLELEVEDVISGFEFNPYLVKLLEEIKCVDKDGKRIRDKELFDMNKTEPTQLLKSAKNTHGLTGEDARTFVKLRLFLRNVQRDCNMFLWDGSHFGKDGGNQAKYTRKNRWTPDITYKPFSMDLKFVLVHPFFTKKKFKGIVHNEVENPEWRPRPDLWDAKK